MNRHLITLLPVVAFFFVGCSSNERFAVDGIPEWIANGAKLSPEPEPLAPDNALIPLERESGPVKFTYITDDRRYPTPSWSRVSRRHEVDLLERGRDYRIRRLFR